jgi:hypothetical protein
VSQNVHKTSVLVHNIRDVIDKLFPLSSSNALHPSERANILKTSNQWQWVRKFVMVSSGSSQLPTLQFGLYEGRLKTSWTHLITPTQNSVEVRWRSLSQNTSLGKRCTSYNLPPASRKRAADRWSLRNFLPRSSLFMVGKAQKSHGVRSGLYGGCSNGVPPIHFFQAEQRIQFISRPMRFLGFSNREEVAPKQEISKWSTVCSTFSRRGWSVARSASLAKGGT